LNEAHPSKVQAVIKDTDGLYRGSCGNDFSMEQYSSWLSQQRKDNQNFWLKLPKINREIQLERKLFE